MEGIDVGKKWRQWPAERRREIREAAREGRLHHYFHEKAQDMLACQAVISERPFFICATDILEGSEYVMFETYAEDGHRRTSWTVMCLSCAERQRTTGVMRHNTWKLKVGDKPRDFREGSKTLAAPGKAVKSS